MRCDGRLYYMRGIRGQSGPGNRGRFHDGHRIHSGTKCGDTHYSIAATTKEFLQMKYKPLALAAAAVTAGFLCFGGAQAATVMTANPAPAATTATMQDSNIQLASHHWYRHGGHWGRHGGSGVYLGLGLPLYGGYDDYYDDYGYGYGYGPYRGYYAPRAYVAPVGGSHVRWCMNRYRSYDPRSNTFMGYDGDRHRCVSPYRY
jgi:hypothetical protein